MKSERVKTLVDCRPKSIEAADERVRWWRLNALPTINYVTPTVLRTGDVDVALKDEQYTIP